MKEIKSGVTWIHQITPPISDYQFQKMNAFYNYASTLDNSRATFCVKLTTRLE